MDIQHEDALPVLGLLGLDGPAPHRPRTGSHFCGPSIGVKVLAKSVCIVQ